MTEASAKDPEIPVDSEEPTGPKPKSKTISDGLSRLIDAEVELVSGLAGAVGRGVRGFGAELPDRRSEASPDWTRSLISGLTEGSTTFLEDVSKVVRRTSQILLEKDEKSPSKD